MADVDQPDQDTDNSNDLGKHVTEVVQLLLEGSGLGDLSSDALVDVTNSSVCAGQNYDGVCVSSNDSSTREEHVDLILLDSIRVLDGFNILANALGFASEDRLIDAE